MDLKMIFGGVLATLALAASPAAAQDFHASPAGSGVDCTTDAPCGIETAFGSVSADGDSVVLADGDYGSADSRLTSQLFVGSRAIDIRPESGAHPKIWSSAPNGAMVLLSPGTTISGIDLDYDHEGAAAVIGNMKTLDHVRINSTGGGVAFTQNVGPALTIATSMIHASGQYQAGVSLSALRNAAFTIGLTLRGATVVADGPGSTGLTIYSSGQNVFPGEVDATVANSIIRGAVDIDATASYNADTVKVLLKHSNFETSHVSGSGTTSITEPAELGNQSAAPAFRDAAAGDLRQATGSPTIDAGVDDVTPGLTDIDGDERFLGASIDIGADEFVPPPSTGGGGGGSGGGDGSGAGAGGSGPGDGDGAAGPGSGVSEVSGTTGVSGTGAGGPGATPSGPAAGGSGQPLVVAKCVVPRLAGKTLKAAKAALTKAGCALGRVTKAKSPKKVGKVLRQSSKAGARVKRGSRIRLVIGRR